MLRIYPVVLAFLRAVAPLIAVIEGHDRDLARQLRRCASSIALNMQEGSGSRGGTRRERYRNALGSASEAGACLDVAMALGYLPEVDGRLLKQLDGIRAVLATLTR
jgi:four helix bundle protein